ncbi:MAGE-like protein [Elsinoe fawcettii]|nr:MAGE-like protein [Elsinoe fawcettii]
MPRPRKRTAVDDDDDASDAGPSHQIQRRRISEGEEEAAYGDEDEGATQGGSNHDLMVKNLVRLALACEYTRAPLRRSDINAKVLGAHSRQFKVIFAAAQQQLKEIFGMEMAELPLRDKVTAKDRQAAAMTAMAAEQKRAEALAKKKSGKKSQSETQASQSQATQKSNAWILRTILPEEYRTPDILSPPAGPTVEAESQYTALCSFVVSLIMLSGGSLAESKLERYLTRVGINEMTPFTNSMANNVLDKTEKLLKKMEKDGFISRIIDNSSGDETVEYIVGQRGKIEIGTAGVEGLVREVYGKADDPEDLKRRLQRSLQTAAASVGDGSGLAA